jgi:arabinofuranan 3-O-arabinosyltransferase
VTAPTETTSASGEAESTDPGPSGPPPVRAREAVFLVVGSLLLAGAVIGTRWGVFTPDTRPDLYQAPGAFLRSTVQAWVGGSSGLGQGNFNAGAAPVAAIVWLIRTLGAPAWLAVRVWRLALLLVGAWGIRRYLGALMGRRLSVGARLVATVFWVVNPYVVVAGSTTPILLPYALLPWTMLAFLRATRSPRSWRWPALFALAFFAQTGLNAGVVPFFQLLALPAQLVFARWVEGRTWRDLLRVVVRCGALCVAVSLYWLLPSFLASSTGAGIAAVTERPADVARTSSYAETVRGLGNWPLYGRAGEREFLGDYTVYLTSPIVVICTFLIPVLVGLALWRSRARERLLVVALLGFGLPVMVGMFPPASPYPAGSLLQTIFDRVPASLAFRTTNKVGAVVVLAEAIALAIGWRTWETRARQRGRGVRVLAVVAIGLVLFGASAPLWNGGLYPLGYSIPGSWERATDRLDADRQETRVLVVPGGSGGNYRWGMRSPDDLFPSLLARPVAVRNTVVGRGDPAANFQAAFDTALAQGALSDAATSTTARYLGAGDVLVRNDLLSEEIGGPAPWIVVDQVRRDPGLELTGTYGRRGTDTIPGSTGRATRAARRTDPSDARLRPVMTYRVLDPTPPITAAPAAAQVLVVGDGEAMGPMIAAGIVDGSQPVQYLGGSTRADFAEAVARGGRIVLTDTNRRRAWEPNRVANATSPTLTADADIDAGEGSTLTLWPDEPDDQTVAQLTGGVHVGASRDGFGLHPYGRPSNAFDGDPNTAWITGGFNTARGQSVWIDLPKAERIDEVRITPWVASTPAAASVVRIEVGDKRVTEAIVPGQDLVAQIEPGRADRVKVTILEQTEGDNPVGISEISFGERQVRNVTRTPRTLTRLVEGADAATRKALAAMPLDIVLSRARGGVTDSNAAAESQLDRAFDLPAARTFTFEASSTVAQSNELAVAAAREGERPCLPVALVDDELVEARVVSDRAELAAGQVRLEGCAPIELDAGRHQMQAIIGWRLDAARFSSPGTAAPPPADPGGRAVTISDRSATHIDMTVEASAAGPRFLRLGEAYDERWTLTVDGEDAGPPILVDGYSSGWLIDGRAHHLVAAFAPQRAVEVSFTASALAVTGVAAIALLPAPSPWVRRRRRRDEAAAGDPGGAP